MFLMRRTRYSFDSFLLAWHECVHEQGGWSEKPAVPPEPTRPHGGMSGALNELVLGADVAGEALVITDHDASIGEVFEREEPTLLAMPVDPADRVADPGPLLRILEVKRGALPAATGLVEEGRCCAFTASHQWQWENVRAASAPPPAPVLIQILVVCRLTPAVGAGRTEPGRRQADAAAVLDARTRAAEHLAPVVPLRVLSPQRAAGTDPDRLDHMLSGSRS